MLRQRRLRHGERIHVVERRRDEHPAFFGAAGAKAHVDHPEVAQMRQHDTLGPAAGARGVEKHGRVCRMRRDRGKGAVVEQRGEILLEDTARQIGRAERQARAIAQHEPRAAVAQDQLDGCSPAASS